MQVEMVRQGYEKALEWVVIALMAALAFEVTAGVVFRTVGYSLVWYDEVASILLAWLTFYGSALAAARRAHIGCPEVVAMLPPGARVTARAIAEVLVIAFFLLVGWTGYSILEALAADRLVSLPSVSVGLVQSVVPISAVLIVLAELLTLPEALARARAAQPSAGGGGASH